MKSWLSSCHRRKALEEIYRAEIKVWALLLVEKTFIEVDER